MSVEAALQAIFDFKDVSRARGLMHVLDYSYVDQTTAYYSDFIRALPTTFYENVQNAPSGNRIRTVRGMRRKNRNTLRRPPKSGTWGNVFAGNSNVYKEVRVNATGASHNDYCRDVLTEVLIQVILSCDPTYGLAVPKIYGVYQVRDSPKLLIHMEKLDMTFLDYLKSTKPNWWSLEPHFSDLCTILAHFQETYRFNHRDMKPDNLMMKIREDGTLKIKLIDFGYSVLEYEGMRYSGTKRAGGYRQFSFSPTIDLVFMSQYFLDIIPKPQMGSSAPLNPYEQKILGDTTQNIKMLNHIMAYDFFESIVENTVSDPAVTLTNTYFNNNNVLKEKSLAITNAHILSSRHLKEFKGLNRNAASFQTAYNLNGFLFSRNPIEFPNGTPQRFFKLYMDSLEEFEIEELKEKA